MCGATSEQKQLQQEQIDQYQQMQSLTAQEYANNQAIFGPMTKQLQSIFDKGPNQEGMSQEEKNNLNAQTVEGTATNYKGAARAVGEKFAAEGNTLPTGAQDAIMSSIATSSAGEQSREESQVENEDYALGRQNWQQAAQGLLQISSGQNPLGWAGETTNSGNSAEKTANDIASQQNSWINAAIGAAGSIGEGLATGGFKHG